MAWGEKTRRYATGMCASIKRNWYIWLALVVVPPIFGHFFTIGLNLTPSLPYRWYLIEKNVQPKIGEYIAFRWTANEPYKMGSTFTKILAGAGGDVVTRVGRDYYLNGIHMGTAKTHSKRGLKLELGPVGVIPEGHFYVMAPHPDSLDSRYALTGWVKQADVVGRAHALF
jgi:conjugal transfer pilin signal peptidase TrbI